MGYKVKDPTFSTRLDQAMVSDNKEMSLRQAEIAFGVNRKTIQKHLLQPKVPKRGKPTTTTEADEKRKCDWIFQQYIPLSRVTIMEKSPEFW